MFSLLSLYQLYGCVRVEIVPNLNEKLVKLIYSCRGCDQSEIDSSENFKFHAHKVLCESSTKDLQIKVCETLQL